MSVEVDLRWRGGVTSTEVNHLHAEAFGHRVYRDEEWDWRSQLERHSLAWVTARQGGTLVGFVNVLWDGAVHAWLQDVMVAESAQGRGVGAGMVRLVKEKVAEAGCEWLHVDFDEGTQRFYLETCGFTPAKAGVMRLALTSEGQCSEPRGEPSLVASPSSCSWGSTRVFQSIPSRRSARTERTMVTVRTTAITPNEMKVGRW